MNAKKCDRCKKLYELYNGGPEYDFSNAIQTINIGEDEKNVIHREFELCPDCMSKLIQYLYNEKE